MRDYKNIKVPKKYRTKTKRVSTKRAEAGRGAPSRKKNGTYKKHVLKVLAVAAFAACAWLGWETFRFAASAEVFQISGVDIRGVQRLGEADFKKIAGEFRGENIFRADLEAAVRRARANPWIKDVRIRRSLPNRITIEVVERVPHAVVSAKAGRYLLDREAVVIDFVGSDPGAARQLPVVVLGDCRPRPGEPLASESIADTMRLLAEIEARGGWEPGELVIRAASPEAISLVYASREFRVGSGNYSEKLRRLTEIMTDVRQRSLDIAYVDVRAERQAAVLVKKGGVQNSPQSSRRAQGR